MANANVHGGKFLKTNAAATNAILTANVAAQQKDATGGNSGKIDAACKTALIAILVATNATLADAVVISS